MSSSGYGSPAAGQRLPAQQTYEAPACVQNAMMTKDKKPFTYTPGGIDLSQIKSERMAKRLQRNAQAEGATGASQQNRPTQPQSPGAGGSCAAATMGAAAMGMPFQVLPPPPPPPMASQMSPGKKTNGGPAPPPPPPPMSSNAQNTLAPPSNGSKPGSPNAARKSPTPQRFEPPPLGFRPEIKIPPNPMASLRKVPPPVEKNTFWKDEYVKDRSKSPMVGDNDRSTNSPNNGSNYGENINYDAIDASKKPTPVPTPTTTNNQQPETNTYNNNNQQYAPQPILQPQQQYNSLPTQPQAQPQPQQQNSPRPEFRSVAAPQSPAVNIYTRQTDSIPADNATAAAPQRATDSPFRFAQQQQQLQQQQTRSPAISPLAQQQQQLHQQAATTHSPTLQTNVQQQQQQQQQPQPQQQQTVPWRTQRGQQQAAPAQMHQQLQTQPQPIYNNVQQRSRDVLSPAPEVVTLPQQQQQIQFQSSKPTSVGSLYIAPLVPPTEPQAQNIVRQQLQQQQQQQQQRDSPMRQLPQQQLRQPAARWMTTQPMQKEQPEWARPEENGNVVPSSLQRMKSPPPPPAQQQFQQQQQQQQQPMYQPTHGNGFIPTMVGQNFGASSNAPTGLRLQINTTTNTSNQSGPKERIIPIQLEQTPTYAPGQPNFNTPIYVTGNPNVAPTGYVIRSPNQFVDQGYNNFSAAAQQQQIMQEPNMQPAQPLSAPRMIQQQQLEQQQQQNTGGPKTRIVPISIENDGTRGPISQSPVVIQNDPRSPPVQSKSFRILQKITDTVDDGTTNDTTTNNKNTNNDNIMDAEPQLQRPTFAKQMSVQQARNSPTIEQMRRMQIAQDQQQQQQQQQQITPTWNQGNSTPQLNRFVQQQRSAYNNNETPQQYIHPSEQQVPEPKKYTGSAIPSRSFKILQAMTTPENAAEMEHSDNIELNEDSTDNNKLIQIENNNNNNNSNKNNNSNNNNININDTNNQTDCNPTTSITCSNTTTPSSSISSINADSTSTLPQHYAPFAYSPYPPFAWYTPMPNANQNLNGDTVVNWQYPYPVPPPNHPSQVMPTQQTCENTNNVYPPHYSPYPYYYAYYPPPPFSPHPLQLNESDAHKALQHMSPYMAHYPYPCPYPVAPSYSQSSNDSRASSVLPDIIVTPSTDDVPSHVVLQHHIKVEKREPPKSDIEIEEVKTEKLDREKRESSVIDILSKRLEDMSKLVETTQNVSNDIEKHCAGEIHKEFGEKSPINNLPPVHNGTIIHEVDDLSLSSDSIERSLSGTDQTPKCDGKKSGCLQAIKSVTNVQIYNGTSKNFTNDIEINEDNSSESENEEDDLTTADGESDIFDEDDEEPIEEYAIDDEYVEEEDLSVIYEEDSDIERSSDQPKTVIKRDGSNISDATTVEKDNDIVENDGTKFNDESLDNDADDSNSVTVRLPLKFSFSRSSNDENIATVEVGNSQIEERRNSLVSNEKSASFSIAKIDDISDKDDELNRICYDDDCDVSVTISLTPSSRSSSLERKFEKRRISSVYLIEDIPVPSQIPEVESSNEEDVSVSFSLNMRNKFLNQTIKGDITNNIAKLSETEKRRESTGEIDFFATLKATKMQAQKMMEQSANYWGKSTETKQNKNEPKTENQSLKANDIIIDENSAAIEASGQTANLATDGEEIVDIWADRNEDILQEYSSKSKTTTSLETAKQSFWSTIAETNTAHDSTVNPTPLLEEDNDEVDFWAVIEDAKQKESLKPKQINMNCEDAMHQDSWTSLQNNISSTQLRREEKQVVEYCTPELTFEFTIMPKAQNATLDLVESVPEEENGKENDFNTEMIAAKLPNDFTVNESGNTIKHHIYIPEFITYEKQDQLDAAKRSESSFTNTETEKVIDSETLGTEHAEYMEEADIWSNIESSKVKTTLNFNNETKTSSSQEELWNTSNAVNAAIQECEVQEAYDQTQYPVVTDNLSTYTYDPTQYPEEPREVDTDEEIDFWAEIEAKKQNDDEDVTFHKAATFWVSRERQNSVEETPYKPVLPKAFPARLPDEPDVQVDIWAALEAAKGEDPILVDPAVEEEKQLAEEFNQMTETLQNDEKPITALSVESINLIDSQNKMTSMASIHEPVESNVWWPTTETITTNTKDINEEPDFWAEIENERLNYEPIPINNSNNSNIKDELEVKRNNYRKAMAFFTASIDDQKEQNVDRTIRSTKSSNRNSAIYDNNNQTNENTIALLTKVAENVGKSLNEKNTVDQNTCESKERNNLIPNGDLSDISDRNITPTNFEYKLEQTEELPNTYVEPIIQNKLLVNGLPDLGINKNDEQKISVRDRIFAFETNTVEPPPSKKPDIKTHSLSVESYTPKSSLSRNNSSQRSESEMEEDDSGVTDMNKQLSETDTESESFPELRKMTSYQRAATHSRLFKLLQDENDVLDDEKSLENNEQKMVDECQFKPSRRKIVHNVSITRKQNPNALAEAETMSKRRERLSLPLRKNTSIDADNPSTPNSPASPIMGQPTTSRNVNDKLVNELVQSLLLKSDSTHLRHLPMKKLQAAAKRVLEEELDSLDNTSVDSTPAPTPNDAKTDKSYADYYETWSNDGSSNELPISKSQRRSPWTVRCPRVLSSKTINRDLARVTESPEIFMRNSKSPECYAQSRESSVSRWRKV